MTKIQLPGLHGVQHLADGSDPIPGIAGLPDPGGSDVLDLILATHPDAFWKLNETTGTVAHDSSGNSHDLQPQGGRVPPTWAQAVAPTGDTSALFVDDTTTVDRNANVAMTAFTDNFTAGIWVKLSTVSVGLQELLGQSQAAIHPVAGSDGWALAMNGANAAIFVDGTFTLSNSGLSTGTWYFLALVRDAGTWKLYVNGLLQTATQTTNISTGSTATWIGNDGYASHVSYLHNGLLSYGFIANGVVSGTDLLAIYQAGLSGGLLAQGLVWTTDGTGSASWQPNLTTINKTGSTPLTGAVTLTPGSNVTLTQAGQDITIASTGGAPSGTTPTDTAGWMPLTTVLGGAPDMVWDADNDLIPTYGPF